MFFDGVFGFKETAINIGYSCRLLTEDMREVFVIDGADEHEVEVQLKDIKRRIDRVAANNSGGCDNGSVAVVSQNFMSASNLNDSTLLTTVSFYGLLNFAFLSPLQWFFSVLN